MSRRPTQRSPPPTTFPHAHARHASPAALTRLSPRTSPQSRQVEADLAAQMSQQASRTLAAQQALAAAERMVDEATRARGGGGPLTIVLIPDDDEQLDGRQLRRQDPFALAPVAAPVVQQQRAERRAERRERGRSALDSP